MTQHYAKNTDAKYLEIAKASCAVWSATHDPEAQEAQGWPCKDEPKTEEEYTAKGGKMHEWCLEEFKCVKAGPDSPHP